MQVWSGLEVAPGSLLRGSQVTEAASGVGVGTRSWAGRARAEGVRGAGAQAPETVLSGVRAVTFAGVGSFYPLLEYNIRTRFPPACASGSKVAHTHAGGTLTAMAAALARSTPPFAPVTWPD